jgi:hypothetical protein
VPVYKQAVFLALALQFDIVRSMVRGSSAVVAAALWEGGNVTH